MDLATDTTEAGLVIRVLDTRIDAASAIEFKEAVRQAAQAPGSPVILDLSQVAFIDSSGLGALVAVLKLLGPDRPLQLAAAQPNVSKVFRLTRMDSVFTIHDSVPTGLRAAG